MRTGSMFNLREFIKRFRRLFDGNCSRKKIFFAIIFCGLLLYLGVPFVQWLFTTKIEEFQGYEEVCIKEKLSNYNFDIIENNAIILKNTNENNDNTDNTDKLLPYIGNGVFGVQITTPGRLYIRHDGTLSLYGQWDPLVSLPGDDDITEHREATVMHFTNGIVNKHQCFRSGYKIDTQYYAHRQFDNILVQDVIINNPSSVSQDVVFKYLSNLKLSNNEIKIVKIEDDTDNHEYTMTSGTLTLPDSNQIIVVSILYKIPDKNILIKPRSTVKFKFLTSIYYSEPQISKRYLTEREVTQRKAIEAMKKVLNFQRQDLQESHINSWKKYWQTGFSISESKAQDALNGLKINSTIYYVLSQVPKAIEAKSQNLEESVSNNEGCYRGHHTLDAPKLWKDTSTIDGVNSVVKTWLITLEKLGCHHLMKGGPTAVQQAIILSLGGLRFSNQHLEFNIDPSYLHRNYLFRRINYGNVTHVNISVTVGDDNRAVLGVALDRSDSDYYGCDAGCLDSPVPLKQAYTTFPVKLTKPLTAILYITADYQHMQDLRKALHVHTIHEAPAHDHQVIALHKHGHQLGGLPTFFWVTICFLIVVFHLFLCKLIITEYCTNNERPRLRHSKP